MRTIGLSLCPWRLEARLVKHGPPFPTHHHNHILMHTLTPLFLSRTKCFQKPCISVSNVLEPKTSAAVAAELEKLKNQSEGGDDQEGPLQD